MVYNNICVALKFYKLPAAQCDFHTKRSRATFNRPKIRSKFEKLLAKVVAKAFDASDEEIFLLKMQHAHEMKTS
ncbi:CLUMA_CG000399, isoform A [Clunio marinus]|uniref:CLUMA_CG000399, isoform A n=1 Tax=Clunio marinus TaxID=568069 RepID=A0A1J1HE70_9DIPT|nr:CLUMA_CG000399, isoform A [Clunio marinus]